MKLSILQENLNKGLSIGLRAIASRPQLPVLSHVLLTAEKGRLKIASTDLETGVNLWVGAKIEKEGSISVPAKILADFISSLPPEKINLESQKGILKVDSGHFKARFNGLASSEFPKMSSGKGEPVLAIAGQSFVKAASQVAFAAASDETRPVLTGIYLFAKESFLVMVATDGYRLSFKKIKHSGKQLSNEHLKKGLIIPARVFQEASKVVEGEEEVKIYFSSSANQLIFRIGEVEIITRLIEGTFPEFEKIIPKEGKTKVLIETNGFTKAVRSASIFARESADIVRFGFKKGELEVSANAAEVGENKTSVDIKLEGDEDKIAFNSRYLIDFLNIAGSESFSFEMSGSLSPGVFRLEKDPSFLHVIMPVRIQE